MQDGVRQLYPFGRHFTVDGTIIPIFYRGHQCQTMRGVPRVFLVLIVVRNGHGDTSTELFRRGLAERGDAAATTRKSWRFMGDSDRRLARHHL